MRYLFIITLIIFGAPSFALTADEIDIMRDRGIQVKEDLGQREFANIREGISVEDFMQFHAISFSGSTVVNIPAFLFEMSNLRELDLSYTDVRIESLIGLSKLRGLERLDISNNENLFAAGAPESFLGVDYDNVNHPDLADILLGMENLKILTAVNIGRINDSYWDSDIELGNQSSFALLNLRELRISDIAFFNGERCSLIDMGIANQRLRLLYISDSAYYMCKEDFVILSDYLEELSLIDINSHNPFASDRVLPFFSFPKLRYLNLSDTYFEYLDPGYKGIFALPSLKTMIVNSEDAMQRSVLCAKFPENSSC